MSTNISVPSFIDIKQICIQRSRLQLYNIHPPRYEIVSPYPQYTPFQLSMRRKAEILKHASTSQSNRLTKTQKFAKLVKNNKSSNNLIRCQGDQTSPSLTSSCNVPGPIQSLYYDPTVQLYQYTTFNQFSHSENDVNTGNNLFLVMPSTNPVNTTNNQLSDIVGTFCIQQVLSINNLYTFKVSIPVSVSVNISSNQTVVGNFNLSSIYFYIYYNQYLIASNDTSAILHSPYLYASPTITFPSQSIDFNSISNAQDGFFLGNINISVTLYGRPGMIYDLKLKGNVNTSDSSFTTQMIFNPNGSEITNQVDWVGNTNDVNKGFQIV